ncbi:chemoreceptor glutamine deamidase CheD [Candidatus Halobonum tyrrellensis]|uniref:Probable chemoreceptor glutamine deamidase CheD n=1 Tax=Candidatus Halobonum tyrrellensis G22 TaxID=1324957 RepID=V4J280_9EURY|nr:chemoreceptor glutamine deamidase CheD [Candidatus Halobonum tyrrellensis]ESP89522.1 chemoreceptor glutamine deamidase CheD [Candidatus Halobonum tyrrellensis G22]
MGRPEPVTDGGAGSVDTLAGTDAAGGERLKVGLSEARVAGDGALLVTSGLGSCLGIVVYDPTTGVGGLLHAMLPAAEDHPGPDEKFVTEGVAALVAALADEGVTDGLRAKFAGGAAMLNFSLDEDGGSIGDRNVAAAEAALADHDVPVVATDTGGDRGRSLRFETATGRLHVSSADGDAVI